MLVELRTFIELARAGSVHETARRVFVTPSAVTRQIQRLEAALGVKLLDRRVKPPRLTSTGLAVLERGRELLRSLEELKTLALPTAEPTGVFRLGVAHALARAGVAAPIMNLSRQLPKLRFSLSSDLTTTLVERMRTGDLSAALVLAPSDRPLLHRSPSAVIATERFTIVAARSASRNLPAFAGPWILNPHGCIVRESIRAWLEKSGVVLNVATEVHDVSLQLSMVASGLGLGVVPARILAHRRERKHLVVVRHRGWVADFSIVFVRSPYLGALQQVATLMQKDFRAHYDQAREK